MVVWFITIKLILDDCIKITEFWRLFTKINMLHEDLAMQNLSSGVSSFLTHLNRSFWSQKSYQRQKLTSIWRHPIQNARCWPVHSVTWRDSYTGALALKSKQSYGKKSWHKQILVKRAWKNLRTVQLLLGRISRRDTQPTDSSFRD